MCTYAAFSFTAQQMLKRRRCICRRLAERHSWLNTQLNCRGHVNIMSHDGPTWMVAKGRSVQDCFQLFENVAGPSSVVCVVEQCGIM